LRSASGQLLARSPHSWTVGRHRSSIEEDAFLQVSPRREQMSFTYFGTYRFERNCQPQNQGPLLIKGTSGAPNLSKIFFLINVLPALDIFSDAMARCP
jgi:hypothetical protein